jgi:hypothetical protein
MVVKIHFETLSPGLKAKLDAKYRVTNNHRFDSTNGFVRKTYRNGNGASLLEDEVKMAHSRI